MLMEIVRVESIRIMVTFLYPEFVGIHLRIPFTLYRFSGKYRQSKHPSLFIRTTNISHCIFIVGHMYSINPDENHVAVDLRIFVRVTHSNIYFASKTMTIISVIPLLFPVSPYERYGPAVVICIRPSTPQIVGLAHFLF